MMTSGMHSQNPSANKESSRFITATERDSAYNKIQRGKADAVKVGILNKALYDCDGAKEAYLQALVLEKVKSDSLAIIKVRQKDMIHNLEEVNKDQKKAASKRTFLSFLEGAAVGAALLAILTLVL